MKSNLDVWAIQENKDETRIALEKVDKDSLGNILYLNCLCSFKIGKERVEDRRFNTCFYSEESDTVIFFAKGMISEEEIENYLEEFDIKYTTIRFTKYSEKATKMQSNQEIWFAREESVLKDAIDDSINKNINIGYYYSNIESKIKLGYLNEKDEFCEIDGRFCKGAVVLKDKLILLVNQKDPRNIKPFRVEQILKNKGIRYKIKDDTTIKRK